MTKATTTPKSGLPKAAPEPNNALKVAAPAGTEHGPLLVQTALRPSVRAAVTTQTFSRQFGELDINALVDQLASHAKLVINGDLERPEAMLLGQAQTLEAIFHELARRAALNMGEYLGASETYMRLALKAQSQCRATIETLAEIKNPKSVAFVQQANIANGPQQVNNGPPPAADASHARESKDRPNELLEQHRYDGLDTRAAHAAGRIDSAVESVEALHGTQDARGESDSRP